MSEKTFDALAHRQSSSATTTMLPLFPSTANYSLPNRSHFSNFCDEIRELQKVDDVLIDQRFPFVVVAGCTVCLAGIFATFFLIHILTRKGMQANTVIYLVFLAFFDIAIMVNYILLISIGLMKSYFKNVFLNRMYFKMLKPLFTLGRLTQASQTFLILAATMERYLIGTRNSPYSLRRATGKNLGCSPRCRYGAIFSAIALAFCLRWSSYLEVNYALNDCEGLQEISFEVGKIVRNEAYKFYSMVVCPIILTYLPFGLLLWLNFAVLRRMRYTSSMYAPSTKGQGRTLQVKSFQAGQSRAIMIRQMLDRRVLRDATNTMGAIVTGYLISNLLNVVVSLIEQTNIKWLYLHIEFYTVASDISSFLVILTSASRLPIYYWCNTKIKELCDQTCARAAQHTANTLQGMHSSHSKQFSPVRTWDDDEGSLKPIPEIERTSNGNSSSPVRTHELYRNIGFFSDHAIHVRDVSASHRSINEIFL